VRAGRAPARARARRVAGALPADLRRAGRAGERGAGLAGPARPRRPRRPRREARVMAWRAGAALDGRARRSGRLRLLVLAVSDRCDQRCVHCSIWEPGRVRGRALSSAARLALVDEAVAEGVEAVLLTGGEPLLSPDLWPVAERFARAGVRRMLATNGMLL